MIFSTTRRRRRIAAAAISLSLGITALIGAPAAPATTELWHGGGQASYIGNGAPWQVGPARYMNASNAWVIADACVGGIDVYGGGLSGGGYCSANWSSWTLVSHPYCGCVLRDPAVYPFTGSGGAVGSASVGY